MKSSDDLRLATSLNHGDMILLPTMNSTPSVMIIFNAAKPNSSQRLPLLPPANAGIRIISGTTAMSCINKTPIDI